MPEEKTLDNPSFIHIDPTHHLGVADTLLGRVLEEFAAFDLKYPQRMDRRIAEARRIVADAKLLIEDDYYTLYDCGPKPPEVLAQEYVDRALTSGKVEEDERDRLYQLALNSVNTLRDSLWWRVEFSRAVHSQQPRSQINWYKALTPTSEAAICRRHTAYLPPGVHVTLCRRATTADLDEFMIDMKLRDLSPEAMFVVIP